MTLNCITSPHQNLKAIFHESGILELTLNRPERKNAFFGELYLAATQALIEAEHSEQVRVVLLRGDADFSAGNDLQDFIDAPPENENSPAFNFLHAAHQLSKPLVVAVKGFAIGIGATILLHADLVYADAKSRFQLPFLNLGLTPEGASTLLLPQRAGYLKAAELLFLGEIFHAEAAMQAGLINQVISDDDVYEFALKKAQKLTQLPIATLKTSKALLRLSTDSVAERINREAVPFAERAQSNAFKEAAAAFKEKRTPNFRQFD